MQKNYVQYLKIKQTHTRAPFVWNAPTFRVPALIDTKVELHIS